MEFNDRRPHERLSHEGRVSVAEEVMERSGLAGRTLHAPFVKGQSWPPPEEHAHVNGYIDRVLKGEGHEGGIRIRPKDWDAQGSQAMTDGYNKIGLRGEHASEMTILHECAHVLHRHAGHAGGHGPEFIKTLHGLYRKHLGPEAAETFANLALPR